MIGLGIGTIMRIINASYNYTNLGLDNYCYIMLNLIQLLLINFQIPRMLPTLSKKELVHPLANVKKSQVPCLSFIGRIIVEKIDFEKSPPPPPPQKKKSKGVNLNFLTILDHF